MHPTSVLCGLAPTVVHRLLASNSSRALPHSRAAPGQVIASVQQHFSGSSAAGMLPSTKLVRQAISHVSQERNGYLAWTLYAHLRQGGLPMDSQDLAALAGAMLHVDRELYTEQCVKRALSVLDYARSIGEAEDIGLLGQASPAASALTPSRSLPPPSRPHARCLRPHALTLAASALTPSRPRLRPHALAPTPPLPHPDPDHDPDPAAAP